VRIAMNFDFMILPMIEVDSCFTPSF